MSYCVNCGVELDSSAKKCALCDTVVINPNITNETKEVKMPFSNIEYIPKETQKKFIAGFLSLVLLISNIVCVFSNMFLFKGGFWSFYILSSSVLLWVIFIVPFFMKKTRKFLMWAFDTVSVGLYTAFLFYMNLPIKLYFTCALPIVLCASFLVFIYMLWVTRKKRNNILKAVFIFCDIAVFDLFTGIMLTLTVGWKIAFPIGVILFLCIIAVIVFLAVCYRSKTVREWLSKKLFI